MVAALGWVCADVKILRYTHKAPLSTSLESIANVYRGFSQHEAHGRSLLYEELANEVARDLPTLELLSEFPPSKQQPNPLFAAVRFVCGTAHGWEEFRDWLNSHREQIRQIMLKRRTQTNEPARCAALLPVLALLPQPLALLEIGASAGLCLVPDRYAYRYNENIYIAPSLKVAGIPPTFSCNTNVKTPIPKRNVEVVWRAGLDLEPITCTTMTGLRG